MVMFMASKTDSDPSKASSLNVVNIGGVFVVLLCGLTFALMVAVAEFALGGRGGQGTGGWPGWAALCTAACREAPTSQTDRRQPRTVAPRWGSVVGGLVGLVVREGARLCSTDCSSCQSLAPDGQRIRYM